MIPLIIITFSVLIGIFLGIIIYGDKKSFDIIRKDKEKIKIKKVFLAFSIVILFFILLIGTIIVLGEMGLLKDYE